VFIAFQGAHGSYDAHNNLKNKCKNLGVDLKRENKPLSYDTTRELPKHNSQSYLNVALPKQELPTSRKRVAQGCGRSLSRQHFNQ
jgi:hypothetical protein